MRAELPNKFAAETKTYAFDFSSLLAVGETISTAVVAASVYSGADASPSSLISGTATIASAIVTQKITAGTEGVIYELACSVTTSAGQTLRLPGYLAVLPETT